MIYSPIIYCRE